MNEEVSHLLFFTHLFSISQGTLIALSSILLIRHRRHGEDETRVFNRFEQPLVKERIFK